MYVLERLVFPQQQQLLQERGLRLERPVRCPAVLLSVPKLVYAIEKVFSTAFFKFRSVGSPEATTIKFALVSAPLSTLRISCEMIRPRAHQAILADLQ